MKAADPSVGHVVRSFMSFAASVTALFLVVTDGSVRLTLAALVTAVAFIGAEVFAGPSS